MMHAATMRARVNCSLSTSAEITTPNRIEVSLSAATVAIGGRGHSPQRQAIGRDGTEATYHARAPVTRQIAAEFASTAGQCPCAEWDAGQQEYPQRVGRRGTGFAHTYSVDEGVARDDSRVKQRKEYPFTLTG